MLDQPQPAAADVPSTALTSAAVAAEILPLLQAGQKSLPPKYFYDSEGVRLFGEITRLPEYYLTRSETALLGAHAGALAQFCPPGGALLEWGASDEGKALHLLQAGQGRIAAYVPVDISASALDALTRRLAAMRPDLALYPVVGDFAHLPPLPAALGRAGRLGFFPGSTIGNFTPAEAVDFLRRVHAVLGAGAALILGADMVKDIGRLLAAYDDAAGVTAAFNRNILRHLNALCGADFEPDAYAHAARWNAQHSRIEMHLVARRDQVVCIHGTSISIAAGESIHTENSHKYTQSHLAGLAAASGFAVAAEFLAPEGAFSLQVWRAL